MKKQSAAIILAAGLSERMGKPKFALKFDAKKTFLVEIVGRFVEFGCEEIIVVLNPEGKALFDNIKIQLPDNVKIAVNPYPEKGRFSSIKIGLMYLKLPTRIFIHNVDNPYVDIRLLGLLFNNLREADYCVPVYKNRGGHPILISGKVFGVIKKCNHTDLILKEFLKVFKRKTIEVNNPNILININTHSEYQEAFDIPIV